jgi:alpha-amylase
LKKLEGYVYVLTHPGIPTVFWEHFFEDSEKLKEGIKVLLQLRKRRGIVADSPVCILTAEHDQYVADVQGQHGTVRVHLGPKRDMGDKVPKEGWEQVLKGADFCVWEKTC